MKIFSTRFVMLSLTLLGISIAVIGVAPGWTQNSASAQKHPHSVYAALAEVPLAARAQKNPFEGDSREATAGGKLFEQHCADCHGRKAGGARRGPSLLGEEVQQATPGTLFWILSNGVVWHGMPVWSKLPEPERWQIVTFLQSLNTQSTNSQSTKPPDAL
jgi:mono/diheme cytochrome c family protein